MTLIAFGALIFQFQQPIAIGADNFIKRLNFVIQTQLEFLNPPCQKPIYYSLGDIDPRFNISRDELLSALSEAEAMWSKPLNKELLAYADNGRLKINLTYDYRQEATDKLKAMGIVVTSDQKSYDDLRARYDVLKSRYQAQKIALDSLTVAFNARQSAYQAEVDKWNSQGGAPEKEFNRLNDIRNGLNADVANVNRQSSQLNAVADDLNAEGTALNKLIEQLNLNVDSYNNIGSATGKEFQEGIYTEGPEGKAITVFEFNDRKQLIRLLAHEIGHALGLDHTASSGDIMYYLNDGQNDSLTANDLSAIKDRCRLK